MKILLVTEKHRPSKSQRDGGARLVDTLQRAFGDSLDIMQFGIEASTPSYFVYPVNEPNRFERRLANAHFIAKQVKDVEQNYTHLIFIHISMQFGFVHFPLRTEIEVWTFPMFLTPSYIASGENVPKRYFEMERLALLNAKNIITPSYFEKQQLMADYSVPEECIQVIPRGIDRRLFSPKVRYCSGAPKFCSIGSIKPQKNILGLIDLFSKVQKKYPSATLQIIGPVQNEDYYKSVCSEIQRLDLERQVKLTGYLSPHQLSSAIEDSHLHLSRSTCETFGRSIFETLASGLPNIVRRTGNAASAFLEHLPYAKFIDDNDEALSVIEEMLRNLSALSSMAIEVGELYDDEILSRLMVAKICKKEYIAISDFDGTLFHKEDPDKTKKCLEAFQTYPKKILCSARPIHDLLEKLSYYNLQVDWIIGCSGSIVTDGFGKLLWLVPISVQDLSQLKIQFPSAKCIEVEETLLQISAPIELVSHMFGLRVETYQNTAFIAHWEASKLRAVHRLLRYIDWSGQVCVFGDGPYDMELLTYFDGFLITDTSK